MEHRFVIKYDLEFVIFYLKSKLSFDFSAKKYSFEITYSEVESNAFKPSSKKWVLKLGLSVLKNVRMELNIET